MSHSNARAHARASAEARQLRRGRQHARLLLLVIAATLHAQMGSPGGGETQAIALHPTNPQILYVGAAKGLCKTTKGGLDNWPSTGLDTYSPRTVAIDPANPDTVYAGTYEMGVYKTIDAAGSWHPANEGLSYPEIRALALDPANPQTLYAGTDGGGVFQSTDGAKTWRPRNHGLFDKTVRVLLISPSDPKVLYAGTWHGVYTTRDGGETWAADPAGLYDVDVRALAFDPTNPQTLYAATHPRGVYRSEDAGQTWMKSREPLTEDMLSIAVDPKSGDVYVGTRAGVFRSTDRGDTWKPAGLHWSNRAWTLVFDGRTDPPTLYYGGEGGVLKTQNGGLWWDVTGPKRP